MKKRVILIEDDQDSCLLFKHILAIAGYDVQHYNDGSHFFQSQVGAADLYIFDICLPGIDGIALTKYLRTREESRNTPVLIISSNHAIANKVTKAGATAFLAKPFQLSDFSKAVRELIHRSADTYTSQPALVEQPAC
jgi:two-component system chemotaxis response regulator CheY